MKSRTSIGNLSLRRKLAAVTLVVLGALLAHANYVVRPGSSLNLVHTIG